MTDFVHQRHKPPRELERPRELVVVCAPLRSNVNLARILRTAACCGVRKLIACGNPKVDRKIARDSIGHIELIVRRSLPPVLRELRSAARGSSGWSKRLTRSICGVASAGGSGN